ncbi:MAG TPA: ParB/RepB/Spo0J family partition protein [Aeromonadales bacterium]|nr:ParB/RepB/Spo0J family partition protein [Aeromonadales bacterium]
MMVKKTHLGRGLDALLSKRKPNASSSLTENEVEIADSFNALKQSDTMKEIPVEYLQRGKYQPRRDMSEEGLDELANSIKQQGVIQPVVVRAISADRYEIIAGERRWRAAQRAGLANIPCVIRNVPDEAAIAMSLVENIQREDLNAIEEAFALQRLMQEFELTHQQTADAVGKSRTTITNLLRLLNLAEETRLLVERGDLEMGHARALLAMTGQEQQQTARIIVAKGLTVRETESLIRKTLNPKKATPQKKDANSEHLQNKISEHLGSPVMLKQKTRGKGELVIKYSSLDELDGILKQIGIVLD